MPKDSDLEGSALVVLRSLIAFLDEHPAARQYLRGSSEMPELERQARALIAKADREKAVKP